MELVVSPTLKVRASLASVSSVPLACLNAALPLVGAETLQTTARLAATLFSASVELSHLLL
jgi:hypothetical protein